MRGNARVFRTIFTHYQTPCLDNQIPAYREGFRGASINSREWVKAFSPISARAVPLLIQTEQLFNNLVK